MKKRLILIGFILVIALMAGATYFWYQNDLRFSSVKQFENYSPHWVIDDYEFVGDHKAVVVNWKDTDIKKTKLMRAYAKKINFGPFAWRSDRYSSDEYIVSQSFQLKSNAFEYDGDHDQDENWLLNVYHIDADKETLEQKEYDLFKLVDDYSKGAIPHRIFGNIYYDNNNYYMGMSIRETDDLLSAVLLNLSNGKITPITFTDEEWKQHTVSNIIDGAIGNTELVDRLSDIGVTNLNNGFDLENKIFTSNNSTLKDNYSKAYQLLAQTDSEMYLTNNQTDITPIESLLQLFYPKGTNVFESVTIPADYSTDGQAHTVNSYEEFVQYYKEKE